MQQYVQIWLKKNPESCSLFTAFPSRVEEEMKIKDLSDEALKVAISNLEAEKSAGYDEISPGIVKASSTEIFKPL